jgi:hypothetical protein
MFVEGVTVADMGMNVVISKNRSILLAFNASVVFVWLRLDPRLSVAAFDLINLADVNE